MNITAYKKNKSSLFYECFVVILLFILIISWFFISFNNIQKATDAQQLCQTRKMIQNASSLCYSIEGSYPPNIEYLVDNYDLVLNQDKYLVLFEAFASNVMPEISIFYK